VGHERGAPDLLAIGHATRDLLPGGGWRLGGGVTFAALTALRLGARPAVVTSGTPELVEALGALLPAGDALALVPAGEATTFENVYTDGGTRRQHLRGRAETLAPRAVPERWRGAPMVLLTPLAQEVAPELVGAFPDSLLAATPQGWLRRWRADGAVYPGPFDAALDVLPHLDALIVSREDLLPPPGSGIAGFSPDEADTQIAAWARVVPIVVVTRGARGADLYLDGEAPETFPGYPAREVDPTGAGDVFAAAFLLRLHETGDARAAVDFANRVAALSVEGEGVTGIPTRATLLARYPDLR
jgi:hypothetical protein